MIHAFSRNCISSRCYVLFSGPNLTLLNKITAEQGVFLCSLCLIFFFFCLFLSAKFMWILYLYFKSWIEIKVTSGFIFLIISFTDIFRNKFWVILHTLHFKIILRLIETYGIIRYVSQEYLIFSLYNIYTLLYIVDGFVIVIQFLCQIFLVLK